MNTVQKVAAGYLLLLLVAIYGYAVGRFQLFPYALLEPLVSDVQAFTRGDPLEKDSSVLDKVKNDLGLSFERMLYDYPKQADKSAKERPFPSLRKRAEPPWVYVDPSHQQGYRVIVGAMNLEGAFWGALLLDPEGNIVHSWDLSTEMLASNEAEDHLKILYGVHVYPDGSVIFGMHETGGGIVKVDACSNLVWGLEGKFHHTVSPDDHGHFWSFAGITETFDQDMVKVSADTGKVVQRIDMTAVREANPDLHIWNLQHVGFNDLKKMKQHGDMTHANDIEPLPMELAEQFPDFEPGDLVVSYATTNLIFVVNPETLKVKWWRVGIADFQHDPDWEPGGVLGVFSNNTRSGGFSTIVTIDPSSYEHRVVHDGEDVDFRPGINGRHQLTAYNTRMITSAQQGWAYEVNKEGDIVFSFVNNVDRERRRAMHLSEAWRFPEDYFDSAFWERCASQS